MRRWASVVVLLVTGALAAPTAGMPTGTPAIRLAATAPHAGERVLVSVVRSATCGRIVATAPGKSRYPIGLTRRAGVCRGAFRFPVEGRWTLRFGRVTKIVRVLPARPTPHPEGARLGRAGCEPASPTTSGRPGPLEAFGTATGAELWALFFHGRPASATEAVLADLVGKELKLVLKSTWGMTFTSATAPDGTERAPVWQQGHAGSNWDRPGGEWGTGWQITEPGCWRIHVGARDRGADLWFRVVS